jgi:hypothetical protein
MSRLLKLCTAAFVVVLLLAATARAEQITGTVTELLPDQMQFVIADKDGKLHTFTMDEDAQVLINELPAVLEDVQYGDRVVVIYRVDEASWLAIEVKCKR